MRLLSWNIHGCVGRGGAFDPDRTARLIGAVAPDVAVLQEVDTRKHGRDPLARVLRALGPHRFEAPAIGDGDAWYGQAVLSRYPFRRRAVHDISVLRYEPRRLIDVTLGLPDGRDLRLLATHLGLKRGERRRQLAAIGDAVARHPDMPTVLAGDLNEWLPQRPLPGFGARTGAAGAPRRTFPATFPLLPLDRIAARPAHLIADVETVRLDPGASDHLPLLATLAV